MPRLTLAQIAAAEDRPTLDVAVPEWGGTVGIRSLSAAEAVAFADELKALPPGDQLAFIVSRALVDDAGNPACDADAVKVLAAKNRVVLERLAGDVLKHNGMAPDSVEDAAKNSEGNPASGSSTASRRTLA